ncbi:hypothetical protein H6P81_004508 [Aristolochia fimbriata]|uniref:Cytochrome P450 n=1 Tax=Aristolochia fimbriata TaxID=158543 RepID=A0AAV7FHN0_ARIFI|nr:hypothetical protein H6P81_004508 [Aristolochia fimbriata]
MDYFEGVFALLGLWLIFKLWKMFVVVIWRPYALTKWFEKQGLRGPSYKLMSGSLQEIKRLKELAKETIMEPHSHCITPRVLPHYHKWSSEYGKMFFYWFETEPRLCITDPELVKEVLSNKFSFFAKPKLRPSLLAIIGKGLARVEGVEWVRHRRILTPAFNIDNIKVMTKRMAACTLSMLDAWQQEVNKAPGEDTEMEMSKAMQELAADIIAHTAFGSSFIEGKEVFDVLYELERLAIISGSDIYIPGSQYLPTRWNIHMWMLKRKMRNSLAQIIKKRTRSKSASGYGNDLLGMMMGISEDKPGLKKKLLMLNIEEIMEECQTFFFSGHDSTANFLTWTMFLLSLYQDWQIKLRTEVLQACHRDVPEADKLSNLKLLNMVLLEALRLYCPAIMMFRKASKDVKLGNLMIPKHTTVSIPITMIHRDEEYWGEDANEFNPLRFADGAARAARHPNGLIAFSVGPRNCIGQNFAMLEGKMVIAMILQRFSFSLSPTYKHAPADKLSLKPEYGLPILLRPLNAQHATILR